MAKKGSDWKDRFTNATEMDSKPRIIGLSDGEVGTAKTSFWLGAPAPIVVFSLDQGLQFTVDEFAAEKEILIREYEWMPDDNLEQSEAQDIRDKLLEDYDIALLNARTILLDKETNIWELFRYAEFGAPKDSPLNYPELNARYRKFINKAKATDVNLGLIQSMKDDWGAKINPKNGKKGAEKTGNRVPQGFKEADELVHVVLHHVREDGQMAYVVGKSRGPGSRSVQDRKFEFLDPLSGFRDFATTLFPDTEESDWI